MGETVNSNIYPGTPNNLADENDALMPKPPAPKTKPKKKAAEEE